MGVQTIQEKVEAQIMESYESLYKLAYTYVRNQDDALDIVQESVYKAIKNAEKVQQEKYIKTWLWRIVMNTALDVVRKKKQESSLEVVQEMGKEDTYQDFDTLAALNVLDEREKTIIVLRFFEEKKIEEIAEVLNENLNTVKTTLYRSLKKLKIEMTREAVV